MCRLLLLGLNGSKGGGRREGVGGGGVDWVETGRNRHDPRCALVHSSSTVIRPVQFCAVAELC